MKMSAGIKALSIFLPIVSFLEANEEKKPQLPVAIASIQKTTAFEPFTGKVTKNKVRLRFQPRFDAQVLRELDKDEYVLVKEDADEFYGIQPSKDSKGYVFRTFVLDNVVEGSHVNVRLRPELDAPVVTQLNSGYRVNGTIDSTNNKWLEIALPETVRFYVSKDYIQKVGDADLLARMEKKKEDTEQLLETTFTLVQEEMKKPFEEVQINTIVANYNKIIKGSPEFPDLVEEAKQGLAQISEKYQSRKIAYLEQQSTQAIQLFEKNKLLANELESQKERIQTLQSNASKRPIVVTNNVPNELPSNITIWLPVEEALFTEWSEQNENKSIDDFYEDQQLQAVTLRGVIDPYNRVVKNKPGDYMLLNPTTKLPIAFLYSTNVNLQNYVGHEVTVSVVQRPNNFYAFPAYFVLSIE